MRISSYPQAGLRHTPLNRSGNTQNIRPTLDVTKSSLENLAPELKLHVKKLLDELSDNLQAIDNKYETEMRKVEQKAIKNRNIVTTLVALAGFASGFISSNIIGHSPQKNVHPKNSK